MGVIVVIAIVYIAYKLLSEALEKPLPKGAYFDWDAYDEDIRRGMTTEEQLKKRKRGGYYTTKPKEECFETMEFHL